MPSGATLEKLSAFLCEAVSIVLDHRIAQHDPHYPVEIKEPGDAEGDEDQDAPDDHVADRGDQVEIAAQFSDRAALLVEHFRPVQHCAVEVIGKDQEREAEGDERQDDPDDDVADRLADRKFAAQARRPRPDLSRLQYLVHAVLSPRHDDACPRPQ